MVNLFDHDDVHSYFVALVKFYQRKNSSLSLRSISNILGFTAPSIFLDLLRKKRKWNLTYGLTIAQKTKMKDHEREYLECLILGANSRSQSENLYYQRLQVHLKNFNKIPTNIRSDYFIYIVGECTIQEMNGSQRKEFELRRRFVDAHANTHQEDFYRFRDGLSSEVTNTSRISGIDYRLKNPKLASEGSLVVNQFAGKIQSAFYSADYGSSEKITNSVVGQDIYAPDHFRSQITSFKKDTKTILAIDTTLGTYVTQTQFEILFEKLRREQTSSFLEEFRNIRKFLKLEHKGVDI